MLAADIHRVVGRSRRLRRGRCAFSRYQRQTANTNPFVCKDHDRTGIERSRELVEVVDERPSLLFGLPAAESTKQHDRGRGSICPSEKRGEVRVCRDDHRAGVLGELQ